MIRQCKVIDLDDAAAGMIVGAEVLDHQGSVLLPAGAVLSEPLLTSMRRRGIDSVRVIDDTVSAQDLAAERERIALRLAYLFRQRDAGAAHEMLHAEVAAYRMEQLQ